MNETIEKCTKTLSCALKWAIRPLALLFHSFSSLTLIEFEWYGELKSESRSHIFPFIIKNCPLDYTFVKVVFSLALLKLMVYKKRRSRVVQGKRKSLHVPCDNFKSSAYTEEGKNYKQIQHQKQQQSCSASNENEALTGSNWIRSSIAVDYLRINRQK